MNLADLKRMSGEATPGPWRAEHGDVIAGPTEDDCWLIADSEPIDAALIAALGSCRKELIAVVEAAGNLRMAGGTTMEMQRKVELAQALAALDAKLGEL